MCASSQPCAWVCSLVTSPSRAPEAWLAHWQKERSPSSSPREQDFYQGMRLKDVSGTCALTVDGFSLNWLRGVPHVMHLLLQLSLTRLTSSLRRPATRGLRASACFRPARSTTATFEPSVSALDAVEMLQRRRCCLAQPSCKPSDPQDGSTHPDTLSDAVPPLARSSRRERCR